jgi:uncharacterized protein
VSQLFAVFAWDAPGAESLRAETRAAHFAYIESIIDTLAIAGPLKTEDGGFAGSMLVYKADNIEGAKAIFEGDPYFKAGVWGRSEIHPFVAAAGEWVGGVTW